ncbi:MAG: lipid A deacylase LpxR family protein [Gammaproteobacteria bacterium]|nr:lipid A deacylase LpxR family protein [Gammaproteobacteria bacterium]
MTKIRFVPQFLRSLFACAALLVCAMPALSQGVYDDSWTFSVHFENDLFADTDQNYTNGIKLSWVSPDLTRFRDSDRLPDWSHRYVEMLPFINDPDRERNIVLSVGQSMFTPQDTRRRDLIRTDRPYAGWLYLGAAFHSKKPTLLDTMEVQFGVVGPLSFAEQAQTLVHELRSLDKPRGWDHQLENEPGINFVYERKWRRSFLGSDRGLGADFIGHMGGALGNVYTYGNAGFELRAGWNLPKDFGSSPIRPGGDTNDPIHKRDPRRSRDASFGLHFFVYADGRGVLRDIFLDGNTIADSHSVDKRHFVADLAAGAAMTYDRFKLSFAKVIRSREFDGQPSDHRFGSITLSYTF